MANTTSAKKATRKIARRTIVNKSRRTQMRGAVRTVEEAIKSGDREAALKAFRDAGVVTTFEDLVYLDSKRVTADVLRVLPAAPARVFGMSGAEMDAMRAEAEQQHSPWRCVLCLPHMLVPSPLAPSPLTLTVDRCSH